jgi:molecular chaperone DnaK (HSP70)
LGGKTLDVTILVIDNGVIEIVSALSNPNLGGYYFFKNLIEHFI